MLIDVRHQLGNGVRSAAHSDESLISKRRDSLLFASLFFSFTLHSSTTPSTPLTLTSTLNLTMFTGIVEILGRITDIAPLDFSESGGQGFSITIGDAEEILGDCHLGDSIAINGKYSSPWTISPPTPQYIRTVQTFNWRSITNL